MYSRSFPVEKPGERIELVEPLLGVRQERGGLWMREAGCWNSQPHTCRRLALLLMSWVESNSISLSVKWGRYGIRALKHVRISNPI